MGQVSRLSARPLHSASPSAAAMRGANLSVASGGAPLTFQPPRHWAATGLVLDNGWGGGQRGM